ncbi:hypothetical protein H1R20_g9482, partial [Candolleomyces eurysporus]
MAEPMKKSNAYAKRTLSSIPAPLEFDSDSDFAPGAYFEEPKAKKLTKKKSGKSTSRRSATEESFQPSRKATGKTSKSKRKRAVYYNEPNPLQAYFADEEIDLESASEDEEKAKGNNEDEDEDEEEEEEIDYDMSEGDRDLLPQPKVIKPTPSTAKSQPPAAVFVSEDDSVTDDDDSVTEPESEEEQPAVPLQLRATGKAVLLVDDDSVTESESDSDWDENSTPLRPKPGFPLAPGQTTKPAFILDKEQNIKVPAAINTYIRPYQRDGIEFFYRQYNDNRGGLLGDDMGLGKTIQVISFLSAIMKKDGAPTDRNRRRKYVSRLQDGDDWKKHRKLPPANAKWPTCLIIAPSTVVHNWEREFETWGYFEVGMYNGTPKEREPVLRDFKMGRLDVVVTTFDLARRDIENLCDLAWTCVIVDEVHRVKNESSKITNAFHQFACPRRFGLTGTAIQNSYQELFTILDWTNPGRLGTSRQWRGFVSKPLTLGQSATATEQERAKGMVVARILRDKLLPNFFLRRTKDIIKDQLPKKTDNVVFCPLTPKQIMAYKEILKMEAVENLINRDKPCTCGSRKSRKTCCHPFVAGDLFKFMSILIKVSNHLGLILPGPKDTPEQTARNRALAEIAFPDGNIPKYGVAMMKPEYCGKLATTEILLKQWKKADGKNKVLIFTKSVKLLEMLEFHLNTKGFRFVKLDGSTKQSDRMPMIDKFHDDPSIYIFLISTLAGGTGLNLTGANKVIIFDPNWNPAHDLQAMDRAFRFGQTRDVAVYRLLGAGSVEELIYARQIYKQQQMAIGYDASVQTRYFKGVQGDNTKRGELFGLENIFKLHEDKLATKMAIEDANLAQLDWALANLGGSRSKKPQNSPRSELAEAEAKIGKEDAGLHGLGALLFDDTLPSAESTEQDDIQRTLNTIGVKYSHLNDQILVPSRIEEERTKRTILNTKKRKTKEGKSTEAAPAAAAPPKPEWPPRRKHHKYKAQPPPSNPQPSGNDLVATRWDALVGMGIITCQAQAPVFAQEL